MGGDGASWYGTNLSRPARSCRLAQATLRLQNLQVPSQRTQYRRSRSIAVAPMPARGHRAEQSRAGRSPLVAQIVPGHPSLTDVAGGPELAVSRRWDNMGPRSATPLVALSWDVATLAR